MTRLRWDEIGSKKYETGVDRGVLYLPDGTAVAWNGLTEITEKNDGDSTPVYFDGNKISDLVTLGGFVATMKAITYPDEFAELEGYAEITPGIFAGQQRPKVFNLCYRTLVGNDLDEAAGYKLHILYNVTAIPSDKTFATVSEDPEITQFEWEITAIPEEVEGYKPSAHISIDSREVEPDLLQNIEDVLYGVPGIDGALIPMIDFTNFLYFGYKWKIVDNGDGTWAAITPVEGLIYLGPEDGLWTLYEVNASYLSDDIYLITDAVM